jgi:hypothetical protein
MVIDSTPDEIRHTAREALTRMLEIEKCEKVVLNPVFGSSFPCKSKVSLSQEIFLFRITENCKTDEKNPWFYKI